MKRISTGCMEGFPACIGEKEDLRAKCSRLAAELEGTKAALERSEMALRLESEERERLATALSKSELFLDILVSNLPVAFAHMDRDLVYRKNNVIHAEVVGRKQAEILNRTVFDVMPWMKGQTDSIYSTVLSQGTAVRVEEFQIVGRRHDREVSTFWDISYVPVFDVNGATDGLFMLGHEVTERREKELLQEERIRNLEELDRLKRDFINAASHELRTPLSTIMGYSEFLEDDLVGRLNPEQREFLNQIQLGAGRLQRLVDDILDFARLEAGSFRLVLQDADIYKIVRGVMAAMVPQAIDKSVRLDWELPAAPIPMRIDPNRIEQVLLNLVGNAIKFNNPDGQVRVVTSVDETCVRIEVTDTGIGVAPENVPRLFDKFFQVDPSTTREHGGAGLGLSISRALVEAHGGTIGGTSALGKGSTFWFTLPKKQA